MRCLKVLIEPPTRVLHPAAPPADTFPSFILFGFVLVLVLVLPPVACMYLLLFLRARRGGGGCLWRRVSGPVDRRSGVGAGAIPPEFGKLKKLQRFNAGHNIGLSGGGLCRRAKELLLLLLLLLLLCLCAPARARFERLDSGVFVLFGQARQVN